MAFCGHYFKHTPKNNKNISKIDKYILTNGYAGSIIQLRVMTTQGESWYEYDVTKQNMRREAKSSYGGGRSKVWIRKKKP